MVQPLCFTVHFFLLSVPLYCLLLQIIHTSSRSTLVYTKSKFYWEEQNTRTICCNCMMTMVQKKHFNPIQLVNIVRTNTGYWIEVACTKEQWLQCVNAMSVIFSTFSQQSNSSTTSCSAPGVPFPRQSMSLFLDIPQTILTKLRCGSTSQGFIKAHHCTFPGL